MKTIDTPKKIGELLLEREYITEEQLKTALRIQQKSGKKLGVILVDSGIIQEDQLVEVISERLKISKLNISSLVINPNVISAIPVDIAKKHHLLPVFKMGNILTVAMVDPLDVIALDEIRYITKCIIKRAVAGEKAITEAIDQYYSVADSVRDIIGDESDNSITETHLVESQSEEIVTGDSTVVRLVNLILSRAIQDGASDVHIEPDENYLRIRYRVNGVMREEASPPKKLQPEIISRVKIAANLDVSEKRLPQDGRMAIRIGDRDVDLRVSTLPTIHGEKIVVRILDKRKMMIGLPELGLRPGVLERWRNYICKPEGLILISGPTSSGKTSTLYASLQEINNIEKNMITVEDPVEYSLPLINQIQINEKAGLTFASALRSILRQNPDVIMVGEIRDSETAVMAIRAALTGHLVFSTIHTNDTVATITRLVDMGIEKYMVSSALEAVLAQRLVRTICLECKEEYSPPNSVLERVYPDGQFPEVTFYRGTGCIKCRGTGFSGLSGLYELVEITDNIREMILGGASEAVIKSAAMADGYRPLFDAGMDMAALGVTTIDEVLKVTTPERQTESAVPGVSALV
ncbi:MAG: Flp pilus assembly complex ATPase component [FCB group bacterium]|nr:Flp pilus assembly complex ATPase component [FCB group bacterium]